MGIGRWGVSIRTSLHLLLLLVFRTSEESYFNWLASLYGSIGMIEGIQQVAISLVRDRIISDLLPSIYPDDLLFVDTLFTHLGEDEYINLYDFLIQLHQKQVNWCLRVPIHAPLIHELFENSSNIYTSALYSSKGRKGVFHCFIVLLILYNLRSKLHCLLL